ncbi:sigma factor [Ilumatobacter sp.]|uniref:sigma factor n=1 Tax=Ilumatobacter sp. TaxID=1967498 RepID=UPI003C4EEF59
MTTTASARHAVRTASTSRRDEPGHATDEAHLIEAARDGDTDAFAQLYSLHVAEVCRLARRLCRDAYEADDVVSEVFCNTLRALRRGAGPTDALRPYLLRSVRNTVIKVRTRTDSGRADPASPDTLDRPDDHDPYLAPGAATTAFGAVSERHRRVLWSVEVEGTPTAAVAETEEIAAPAAASLAYRARCALRRAYIGASITPTTAAECVPIRSLMAAYVDGGLGAAKSATVLAHSDLCADCAAALVSARKLKSGLGDKAPFAALILGLRALIAMAGRSVAGLLAATPITAVVATATLALGLGAMVDAEPVPDDVRASAEQPRLDDGVRDDVEPTGFGPIDDGPDSTPIDAATVSEPLVFGDVSVPRSARAQPGEDAAEANAPAPAGVDGTDGSVDGELPLVDEVVDATQLPSAPPVEHVTEHVTEVVGHTTGAVVEVVDATTDVVDTVTEVVDRTTRTVTDLEVVDVVVDLVADPTLTQTVDDAVADSAGALDDVVDAVVGGGGASVGGLLGGLGSGN